MLRGLAAHVLAGLQWWRQRTAVASRTRVDPGSDIHPDTPTVDDHVEYTVAHLRYLHLVHAISLLGKTSDLQVGCVVHCVCVCV